MFEMANELLPERCEPTPNPQEEAIYDTLGEGKPKTPRSELDFLEGQIEVVVKEFKFEATVGVYEPQRLYFGGLWDEDHDWGMLLCR